MENERPEYLYCTLSNGLSGQTFHWPTMQYNFGTAYLCDSSSLSWGTGTQTHFENDA